MSVAQRIAHIEARLDRWGEWLVRSADGGGGLGYVSSIYSGRTRVQTSDQAVAVLPGDPEAAQTDTLVVWLGSFDRALQAAVKMVHYQGRHRSLRENARRLGCSHTALRERLARADLAIDRHLQDKAERKRNFAQIPTAA